MRSRIRRVAIGIVVAVVVVGGGLLALWLPGSGKQAIEAWCGAQLTAMADDLLRPELRFDRLTFRLPRTVVLDGVTLVDGGVTVIDVQTLAIELGRVPREGEPLLIESASFQHPVVRLIEADDGSWLGFSDMIRSTAGRDHPDGGSTKPSEVLAIRKLVIAEGVLEWTEGRTGKTMRLDELDLELAGQPDRTTGWYQLDASFARAPIMQIQMDGRLDLDHAVLELGEMQASVELHPDHRDVLPPAVQGALDELELYGHLDVSMTGTVALGDAGASTLDASIELRDAHAARGRLDLPIDHLATTLALNDRQLLVHPFDAAVFGGDLSGRLQLELTEKLPAECIVDGRGLLLERALRETADVDSDYAGAVTLEVNATARLAELPGSISGDGAVEIARGSLMGDPIFGGLMQRAGETDGSHAGTDSGSAIVSLSGDRLELRDVELTGERTAARGEGEIMYDGSVSLRFNAGPLERIQGELGGIGDLLGGLTDLIVRYRVSGTFQQPTFDVHPLGIGAEAEAR